MLWKAIPPPGIKGKIVRWYFHANHETISQEQLPPIRVDSSEPIVVDDDGMGLDGLILSVDLDNGNRYLLAFNRENHATPQTEPLFEV